MYQKLDESPNTWLVLPRGNLLNSGMVGETERLR